MGGLDLCMSDRRLLVSSHVLVFGRHCDRTGDVMRLAETLSGTRTTQVGQIGGAGAKGRAHKAGPHALRLAAVKIGHPSPPICRPGKLKAIRRPIKHPYLVFLQVGCPLGFAGPQALTTVARANKVRPAPPGLRPGFSSAASRLRFCGHDRRGRWLKASETVSQSEKHSCVDHCTSSAPPRATELPRGADGARPQDIFQRRKNFARREIASMEFAHSAEAKPSVCGGVIAGPIGKKDVPARAAHPKAISFNRFLASSSGNGRRLETFRPIGQALWPTVTGWANLHRVKPGMMV